MIEGSELVDEAETGDVRPEGLPDNFRDIPSLVKSYHEATGRLSQLSEENHELSSTLDAVISAQEQAEVMPVQAQPAQSPVDHLGILKILADRASQQAISQLPARENFDISAESYALQVQRLADNDPALRTIDVGALIPHLSDQAMTTPESTVEALRGLAFTSRAVQLHDVIQDTLATQQDINRRMKLSAQTASGAGPKPEVKAESDEDFGRSLIAAHNQSYASRMSRA